MSYQLSSSTVLANVTQLFKDGKYAAAYRAIRDDLLQQKAAGTYLDPDTLTWYTSAPEINDPTSTVPIHYFVRNYVSEFSKLTKGVSVDGAVFQNASDELARSIIGEVIKTGGVIEPFTQVGIRDTQNTSQAFGISRYGWPAYADLAAYFSPNFVNHSFLDGIPLYAQVQILTTVDAAARDTVVNLISSGNGLNAFGLASPADVLYLETQLPFLSAKFLLQKLSGQTVGNSAVSLSDTNLGSNLLSYYSAITANESAVDTRTQQEIGNAVHNLENLTKGYYVTQSGDSWSSIAIQYGVSASLLQSLNTGMLGLGAGLGLNSVIRVPILASSGTPGSIVVDASKNQSGIYDVNSGEWIVTNALLSQTDLGTVSIISSGATLVTFDPGAVIGLSSSGGSIVADLGVGRAIYYANGQLTYSGGGTSLTFANVPGALAWSGGSLLVPVLENSAGDLERVYSPNSSSALVANGWTFTSSNSVSKTSQLDLDASALFTNLNSGVGVTASSGQINNSWLSVTVNQLSQIGQSGFGSGGDGTPFAGNNIVYSFGGVLISASGQANTDLAGLSSSEIANGLYRPYYESLLYAFNNVPGATSLFNSDVGQTPFPMTQQDPIPYLDFIPQAVQTNPEPSFTDPLLIDLTGAGIGVSNWIQSPVFFDTNVLPDANGNPTTTADGQKHQTAWMKAGTAMLVFQAGGVVKPITDITQTVSEFLNAGPTPGKYADGLAALAGLVKTDPGTGKPYTTFSAQTAAIDAATGVSYWNEIMVWNDANHNGVSDTGEIVSLDSLGITSINLAGSGNQGESINGSAVTNRTAYTKSDGSLGAAAAVDFQNDSIGQVVTSSNGGALITSIAEGGPTKATTFVAQNTTAHSYTIAGGKLTDATTGNVIVASGITAVLSSNQGDTISVAATDTGTYWLGGGTGADTLTGGGGTNVFLVNPNTVVQGGTGANSFNIAKIVGTQGVTIDMAKANLQEVIGGAGGDVINASGTTWNVFIQGGDGNSIIIGGAAAAAISGGKGDDLIELGDGGGVVHAGTGNDVIYGGSGLTKQNQPNYVNAGATSNVAYIVRLYNALLGREPTLTEYANIQAWLTNGTYTRTSYAAALLAGAEAQAKYAAQNNTQFTTSIFQALLGRAPSSSELSNFVSALNSGQTRAVAVEALVDSAASQAYWSAKHPGASDVIYAGPGNDVVQLGTNNAEVLVGTGTLTVIGNSGGFSVVGFHGSYADYTLSHNADGTITVKNINNMDGDGTVTMKNVTALDFKDISQVPVASTAGMPVNDRLFTVDTSDVTINTSGQYVISATRLLANDINYAGATLTIRELLDNNGNAISRGASGQVNGGTVALSSDGLTITFTPIAGYRGLPSFRYHVQDTSGNKGAVVQQVGTTNTAEMMGTVYLNTPDLPTDTLFDSEWFLRAASVLPVWKDYTGAGVNVAVFDPSGNVDFSNPDFVYNAGRSIRTNGSPGVDQVGTHATLVAGVIGADRDGQGAVGVAYGATISSVAIPQDAAAGLGNLLDWSQFDVVNNSWTFSPPFVDSFLRNPSYLSAYTNAVANGRGGLGTILVFAGGNERAQGRTTEDLNETNSLFGITVGGINATTDLGSLVISGRPFSEAGSSILVSAPANNISSDGVVLTNDYGQQFGATTETTQGTSFATPIVSGVVALMLQANPKLGYRDVQQILAYSAEKVNDPTPTATDPYNYWTSNGGANWNGTGLHYSQDYGFGEADARAAVRLAETWQAQQTYANLVQSAVQTPNIEQLPTSVTAVLKNNPDGTIGFDHYNYQYGYFSVASGVSGLTLEHVQVTVDLDLTNLPLAYTELVLGRVASRSPYNLWGNVATIYSLTDTSVLLQGETATPGNVVTGSDGHQHLVFSYDTVQYMGENSAASLGWALELIDTRTNQAIVYQPPNWSIQFFGSPSSSPQQWIFTDEYAGGASITPVTGADSFNASAATGNDVIDLRGGSSDSVVDGKSVTVNGNLAKGFGGDGNDTLIANNAGDLLYGGRGNDTLIGGAGNDTLEGGAGNDTIDGGAGSDTVIFTGNFSDYLIRYDIVSNAYTFIDQRAGSPDGTDVISAVETFEFADQTVGIGGPFTKSDTAANVSANISALNIDANLSSITLTDAGTPELTLTLAQLAGSFVTLSKITNASFTIHVSDTGAILTASSGAVTSGSSAGNSWLKIFNADGTEAYYTYDDVTGTASTSYNEYFNHGATATENARITSGTMAGDTFVATFGPTGAYASWIETDVKNLVWWSTYSQSYDKSGNLLAGILTADAGDVQINVYDGTASANIINTSNRLAHPTSSSGSIVAAGSQYINYYNGSVLNFQTGQWTSGAANGNTWVSTFNSSGGIVSQQVFDNNGSNGASYTIYCNASGTVVSEVGTYDSGGGSARVGDTFSLTLNPNGSYATYSFNDITGNYGSSYTNSYNSSGVLLSQSGIYDNGALAGISFAYSYDANGAVAAYTATLTLSQSQADAAELSQIFTGYRIAIVDTAANVAANIAALSANARLSSVTLTDAGTPSLTVSVSQLVILGKITNASYNIAISDTAANVSANMAGLSENPHLTSIVLTDTGTPTLTLTAAQLANNLATLSRIKDASFNIAVSDTGVTLAAQTGTVTSGSGAGDTWLKIFNADGTEASYTFNDSTGASGTSYVEYFNHGVPATESGTISSGSYVGNTFAETFGPTGALASWTEIDRKNVVWWNTDSRSYDKSGNSLVGMLTADTGDVQTNVYDGTAAANIINTSNRLAHPTSSSGSIVAAGSQYINYYNGSVMNFQTGQWTSGAANGNTWVSTFNSSGGIVSQQVFDNNGSNGASYTIYCNASGTVVSEVGTYDSGGGSARVGDTFSLTLNPNGSYATYTFNDITGNYGSSYTNSYNSSGVLLSQSGIYDSGALAGDAYTYTYNADGTVATYSVSGNAGNNTLSGGTTNAVLSGNGGYDTYQFGRGSGQDRIVNGTGDGASAQGELDIGAGVSDNQIWLLRSGNDLIVDIMGTHDQINIANWFGGSPDAQLAHIVTSDGSRLDVQVNQLVQAMATYSSNNSGFDPTVVAQAPSDAALQSTIAAAWHH
ncbi:MULTISPECIES: S8 family serine peptidase [unclassified Bradyrhizobium]|uniref:S8 family serine peptidase n=1 Tax=unclassified Bradyrhizobium TaxID=2631580 RepID=UPI0028EDC082|nr:MULTISPECIES: S8 family serine peptidase [unclassified Bradyrhizobium]